MKLKKGNKNNNDKDSELENDNYIKSECETQTTISNITHKLGEYSVRMTDNTQLKSLRLKDSPSSSSKRKLSSSISSPVKLEGPPTKITRGLL